MLTFLVTSISVIIWLTMWALQYYYAHRTSLAIYEGLGSDAWDRGDIMVYGIIGFFASPIFLFITALDYNYRKAEIKKFYNKDKPVEITKKTVTELYNKLQARYDTLYREKEIMEENLDKAKNDITSLEKKNGHLEELTKSIRRFDLMDLEEERT